MEYVNTINNDYFQLVKSKKIYPMFKVELLDRYENIVNSLSSDVSTTQGGSISINYQQGVRRSISLTFIDNEGLFIPSENTGLIWTDKKFKVYVGLRDIKNGDIYWFSQGVFYYRSTSSSHTDGNKITTINGIDKFAIFTSDTGLNQLAEIHHIPAGSNIYNAIRAILNTDFGNGMVVDIKEPVFDIKYINEVTPYDITKSPGAYFGDMLIELANILGCNIFYDTNGRLNITSGTIDVSYENEPPIWGFSDSDLEYSNATLNVDFSKFINKVVVVGNNVNDVIHTYTAINENPSSPTRIGLNPTRVAYITTSMAYNDDRAKDYAIFELNRKSIVQLSNNFSSSIIPHLDVDKVVTINDEHYGWSQSRFILQSITMPLNYTNLMSLSATNTATLPYHA